MHRLILLRGGHIGCVRCRSACMRSLPRQSISGQPASNLPAMIAIRCTSVALQRARAECTAREYSMAICDVRYQTHLTVTPRRLMCSMSSVGMIDVDRVMAETCFHPCFLFEFGIRKRIDTHCSILIDTTTSRTISKSSTVHLNRQS